MSARRAAVLLLVLCLPCLTTGRSATPSVSATALLDRYLNAEFETVIGELAALEDFDDLLAQLRRDGPGWIAAGGETQRHRRRLVAATVALEAARSDEWYEWKWLQSSGVTPQPILTWKAPPLLIEWGCTLLREDAVPQPIERWWQLAAMAVAQRSEDFQFAVGDPWSIVNIVNTQDEIHHLDHVAKRFPKEPRFTLGQAIALEWYRYEHALMAFTSIKDDPVVGAEATLRLGMVKFRRTDYDDAIALFDDADRRSRDPYVVHLAQYFKGEALNRTGKNADAERAYRRALAARPRAQSASLALGSLLFRSGQREEAQRVVGEMFADDPPKPDPWREYVHADDRFWPELIGRLRREIGR
jgi:tetratricopeptide (TPR) repeat protein